MNYERIAQVFEATVTTVLFGLIALYFYAIIATSIESGKRWEKADAMEAERKAERKADFAEHMKNPSPFIR